MAFPALQAEVEEEESDYCQGAVGESDGEGKAGKSMGGVLRQDSEKGSETQRRELREGSKEDLQEDRESQEKYKIMKDKFSNFQPIVLF